MSSTKLPVTNETTTTRSQSPVVANDLGSNAVVIPTTTSTNYGTINHQPNQVSTLSLSEHSQQLFSAPPKPAVRRKLTSSLNHPKTGQPFKETMQTLDDSVGQVEQKQQKGTLSNRLANIDRTNLTKQKKEAPREDLEVEEKMRLRNLQDSTTELFPIKQTNASTPQPKQVVNGTQSLVSSQPNHGCQTSPTRPYPKKVLFIIANEFCERFSYYGLRTVLVLYFKSVLGFTDSISTISFHLFATLCYLTPILGAILGDSVLGKYKTILYLSIVYFFGELILVLSSVFWDMNIFTISITSLGLLLIGIGTGGIKPCVSAFGGDQFLSHETSWRENFFSLFYGAINLGSLISMFLTPMLRSNYHCVNRSDCYPYAFGLPCLLMFVSIIVFLLAHNYYFISPLPEQNVITAFCQCIWLALKRKLSFSSNSSKQDINHPLSFNKLSPQQQQRKLIGSGESDNSLTSTATINSLSEASSSTSSSGKSSPNVAATLSGEKIIIGSSQSQLVENGLRRHPEAVLSNQIKRDHWLYLASDRFDTKSIEDFRSVLGILLLFLPTPVYWCLFDQQGSLWTLQATRMDGRVLNTNFILEPDQIMVLNPLLLLASIPLFQLFIYPTLTKCNILTSPIQRMTAGGMIAAFAFVASALIELHLQKSLPLEVPRAGQSNLLIVNGLSECSIIEPKITILHQKLLLANTNSSNSHLQLNFNETIGSLEPLSSRSISVQSLTPTVESDQQSQANVAYKLTFKLGSATINNQQASEQSSLNNNNNQTTALSSNAITSCPFDPKQENELSMSALNNQSVKLLYIEQGNGKLTYKLFNESLVLPPAGKARVRLLYEFFGSYAQAQKRSFRLSRESNIKQAEQHKSDIFEFKLNQRDGQVLLSDYIDVDISSLNGDEFSLTTQNNENLPTLNISQAILKSIKLKPGTRNLIILHQHDARSAVLKHELLQDNDYRISVLWQLIPYLMISMSEVMFSITGLEFSYAMAPETMKSLILGAWSLTTALGNILTVAVESVHPFSNIAHDFLFYAALMAVDMLIFAILGYHYKPHKPAQTNHRHPDLDRKSNRVSSKSN